ncbi:hypothetical protein PIB30_020504 [Stylosanthes scabra]|uniref:Reverse transcriptase domain-containing protein n=1 Tax=Stylosanthes scabra TaxID=79078 RepID=A0ABU6X9Z0_9FABA|nr:hypothetical protein [Stylosanthes scabra]
MKYDGSTDPHEHLRDFEHQMVCDRAIDEVKCRAFPVTITGLTNKWFTLSTGSISTFVEARKSFLTKSTIDPHTHTAPEVNAKPHNPRDNQRDSGFKGQLKPLKQKFKNYTPLAAPITEIYPRISKENILLRARPLTGRTNPKYKKQIFVL